MISRRQGMRANRRDQPLAPSASGPAWAPASASGLTLHCDETGYALGAVAQWTNNVGSNHLTQGTGASRPVGTAAVINGVNGVVFDGTDDFLAGAAVSNYISASAYEYYAVLNPVVISASHADPWADDAAIGEVAGYFGLAFKDNTGSYSARFWHSGAATEEAVITVSQNAPIIAHGWLSAGALRGQINGGAITTDATATNVSVLTGLLQIGKSYNSDFAQFSICEIAIWNVALSAGDRTSANAFFAAKYGL